MAETAQPKGTTRRGISGGFKDFYQINGQVVERQRQLGVANLKVEAWDKDLIFDDLLGSAITDQQGRFQLTFNEDYFKEIFFDRKPDLYLKLYANDVMVPEASFNIEVELPNGLLITGTGETVIRNLIPGRTNVTLETDLPAWAVVYTVSGCVCYADGGLYTGDGSSGTPVRLEVKVYDQMLRQDVLLAEGQSDEQGHYRLSFNADQVVANNKQRPDVYVAVFDQGNELKRSEVVYRAQPEVTINIILDDQPYQGPCEFQRLEQTILPLIDEGLVEELTEEDIQHLAQSTGLQQAQVRFLVLAHQVHLSVARIPGEQLQPEILYALYRQNLPTNLSRLVAQSSNIVRTAIQQSIERNIISDILPEQPGEPNPIDLTIEAFRRIAAYYATQPPADSEHSFYEILETDDSLSDPIREGFIERYVDYEGLRRNFWQELRNDSTYSPHVDSIQFTMQLAALTKSHEPLVRRLQEEKANIPDFGLRDLARYSSQDWEDIIDSPPTSTSKATRTIIGVPPSIPGNNQEDQKTRYIKTMMLMLEDAFPTTVFNRELEPDEYDEDNAIDFPGNEHVHTFLSTDTNEEFEFRTVVDVDQYLADNPEALNNVPTDARDATVENLKAIQRLFKVTTRFNKIESINALLNGGIRSAQDIARHGKQNFLHRYSSSIGYRRAKAIFNQARHVASLALNLYFKHTPAMDLSTRVLPQQQSLDSIPNWSELFGAPSFCDAKHCQTILSPSAYLVDLLEYLKVRDLKFTPMEQADDSVVPIERSALDVLFQRRPDIGDLKLSCANANTLLPYVDLVNEILENAVAPESECVNPLDETSGSAEELSATPEHINPGAYDILLQKHYPWNLPFNAFTDEVRAYLNHLGAPRDKLFEAFSFTQPTAKMLVAEYFGVNKEQLDVYEDAETLEYENWGFYNPDVPDPNNPEDTIPWYDYLAGNVPELLKRSGLTFKEFNELIAYPFFRSISEPDISVQMDDEVCCNLQTAQVNELNEYILGIIHRFVRAARLFKLRFDELDQIIRALVSATADNPFAPESAVNLYYLARLRKETKLPLPVLLSWWNTIDTAVVNSTSFYDTLFLNKAVHNPVDASFALNDDRDELLNPQALITDHRSTVLAALQISEAQLDELLALYATGSDEPLGIGELKLAHLSFLHRVCSFCREFRLSYSELETLKLLTHAPSDALSTNDERPDMNPFSPRNPAATQRFVERLQLVRKAKLSIQSLYYILTHQNDETNPVGPTDTQITESLDKLHISMQPVLEEYLIIPEDGEVSVPAVSKSAYLREKLAFLNWDDISITHVNDVILDNTEYAVSIVLDGLNFPDEMDDEMRDLAQRLTYDADEQLLYFRGMMSGSGKDRILDEVTTNNPDFEGAVENLLQQAREALAERTKVFLWDFTTTLDKFPDGYIFPPNLENRISYNPELRQLRFKGWMTEEEKNVLTHCDEDDLVCQDNIEEFAAAVEKLFLAPRSYPEISELTFLSQRFIDTIANESQDQRLELILKRLIPFLRKHSLQSVVIQYFSDLFSLPTRVTDSLFTKWVRFPVISTERLRAIDIFSDEAFVGASNTPVNKTNFYEQFTMYVLLDKIVTLIDKYSLGLSELSWLYELNREWFELNTLPVEPVDLMDPDNTLVLFPHWERLANLMKLRDTIPGGVETLDTLFKAVYAGTADLQEIVNLLAEETGWNKQDVADLTGSNGLNFSNLQQDFYDETKLLSLCACMKHIERLGLSMHSILTMLDMENHTDQQYAISRDFKSSLKAKYSDEQWLNIAKPLQDELREKKRANLVSFILNHPQRLYPVLQAGDSGPAVTEAQWLIQQRNDNSLSISGDYDQDTETAVSNIQQTSGLDVDGILNADTWAVLEADVPRIKSVNDIYEYLLLDVEMDPCMQTSRMKLAISSVQLFIQRCLTNLEAWRISTPLTAMEWKSHWTWMKNYRVWEANRKIFLFPENWIEPELRDDKTLFFIELENDLMQGEVNDDNAERALRNYVEKLDQVARLEICGMYHELESDSPDGRGQTTVDIMHVIARTTGMPYSYYYRRLENGYWTPWETIDLDIELDSETGEGYLIPVVYNRRLFLCWPVFTEKTANVKINSGDTSVGVPNTGYQFKQGGEPQDRQPDGHGTDLTTDGEDDRITVQVKFWHIQLAWSEYRNGKWTPRNITSNFVDPEGLVQLSLQALSITFPPRYRMVFTPAVSHDSLTINCEFLSGDETEDEDVPENNYVKYGRFVYRGCHDRFYAEKLGAKELRPACRPSSTNLWYMKYHEIVNNDVFQLPIITDTDESCEENANPFGIFDATPGEFRLTYCFQYPHLSPYRRFFYEDEKRTFFAKPNVVTEKQAGDEIFAGTQDITWSEADGIDATAVSGENDNYQDQTTNENRIEEARNEGIEEDPPTSDNSYDSFSGEGTHTSVYMLANTRNTRNKNFTIYTNTQQGNSPLPGVDGSSVELTFTPFYMPYSCELIKALNRDGVPGLLHRKQQLRNVLLFELKIYELRDPTDKEKLRRVFYERNHFVPQNFNVCHEGNIWYVELESPPGKRIYSIVEVEGKYNVYDYSGLFLPVYLPQPDKVRRPYPVESLDFDDEAYAVYYWELFFHIPLLIADRLSKNQRFAEAQKWLHYIFDPTDASGYPAPQKFWRTKPFFEGTTDHALQELAELFNNDAVMKMKFDTMLAKWRRSPFNPHLIARHRIAAFQKTVVMKYIDNLIAWGDQLFRRDSIESINEATQLYVLAAEILGDKPELVAQEFNHPLQSYRQLTSSSYIGVTGTLEQHMGIASTISVDSSVEMDAAISVGGNYTVDAVGSDTTLYFALVKNDRFLSYWDIVADRLFKIRHCMNIEGVVRQLPLYEPPIEPGLLVRARALGMDISSVLNDVYAPRPHIRFAGVIQKAMELCSEVKALGGALLATIEKQDAEALSLMRSRHEINMLKSTREIRKQQIKEAQRALDSMLKGKQATEKRHEYYKSIEKITLMEAVNAALLYRAGILQTKSQVIRAASSFAHILPDVEAGGCGAMCSPCLNTTVGGSHKGHALAASASIGDAISAATSMHAQITGLFAGYERRWDEWKLQEKLAEKELEQIEKQILAAEIRLAMAEKELANHELQTENAKEVETFFKDKFTNKDLYGWMSSQLSSLYFQSYQMAYDMAKRAEKAYQHETGDYDAKFIDFGHWDSMRKGLLCCEKLHFELRQMEVAYLDKTKREFEMTKHVSLAMLDPMALLQLKENGKCFVSLPEELFDIDYPGHYFRRIKSVSLSIPCVSGPYTNVNCTLTLLKNSVRTKTTVNGGYVRDFEDTDDRFRDDVGAIESIATSSGQNDNGVFEFNMRGDRYLPFEGAGAISEWYLELPAEYRQFDYASITDVIFHLDYTARNGGEQLKNSAVTALSNKYSGEVGNTDLFTIYSLKHDYSNAWSGFANPGAEKGMIEFTVDEKRFPYMFQSKNISLSKITLLLFQKQVDVQDPIQPTFNLYFNDSSRWSKLQFTFEDSPISGLACSVQDLNEQDFPVPSTWKIVITPQTPPVDLSLIEDIVVIFDYLVV